MIEIDTVIQEAICNMLQWPTSEYNLDLVKALEQLRFPISKGGWGVRSIHNAACPATLGSVVTFLQWLQQYESDLDPQSPIVSSL